MTPWPDIATAGAGFRAGTLSPLELLEQCLERIDRYESQVKAWVRIDREGARRAARELGEELRGGRDRGPLHGIPIGVKDLVDCAGWPTLAGSKLRRGHVAAHDAPLVARLRNAGAIIVGKTVTTEFASFDPSETCNPWNLGHTPGGSSSGSAAAVAAGFCLAAIGSQTGGSITRPASFCGVAGCKPTFGRVPLAGIVPLTMSLDHPGPIARRVFDLAVVLDAIAGYEADDASTSREPMVGIGDASIGRGVEGSTSAPRLTRLSGGYLEKSSPGVRQAYEKALEKLRAAGAEILDVELPASAATVHAEHRKIMAVEAARYHGPLFREHKADFGVQIGCLLQEGLDCPAVEYAAALEHRQQWQRSMQRLAEATDALVTPATVTTAPATLASTGDPTFNSPWSHSHLPTISLPCGLAADGLPVSLQLAGEAFGERSLFGVARWCEQKLDWNGTPTFGPTLG